MMRTLRQACLAKLLCLCVLPAGATASATVTVTNLHLTFLNLTNHPYGMPELLTAQEPIDFLLQNNASTNKTVQMDLDISAYSHVTAVPEPGALAMVMGGLLMVGARVRGRRGVTGGRDEGRRSAP